MLGNSFVGISGEREFICGLDILGSELAGSAEWFSWGVWGEGFGHGCDDIYYLSAASQGGLDFVAYWLHRAHAGTQAEFGVCRTEALPRDRPEV